MYLDYIRYLIYSEFINNIDTESDIFLAILNNTESVGASSASYIDEEHARKLLAHYFKFFATLKVKGARNIANLLKKNKKAFKKLLEGNFVKFSNVSIHDFKGVVHSDEDAMFVANIFEKIKDYKAGFEKLLGYTLKDNYESLVDVANDISLALSKKVAKELLANYPYYVDIHVEEDEEDEEEDKKISIHIEYIGEGSGYGFTIELQPKNSIYDLFMSYLSYNDYDIDDLSEEELNRLYKRFVIDTAKEIENGEYEEALEDFKLVIRNYLKIYKGRLELSTELKVDEGIHGSINLHIDSFNFLEEELPEREKAIKLSKLFSLIY